MNQDEFIEKIMQLEDIGKIKEAIGNNVDFTVLPPPNPVPIYIFLAVIALILLVLLIATILFFRWYFHRFKHSSVANIIGLLVIVLPTVTIASVIILIVQRKTFLVQIINAECTRGPTFHGYVLAKNLNTNSNIKLKLPLAAWEDGRADVLDNSGKFTDVWYNRYFCYEPLKFDKLIKGRTLNVTTDGFDRIIKWQEP